MNKGGAGHNVARVTGQLRPVPGTDLVPTSHSVLDRVFER
jgi:hypothetical protein